MKRKLQPLKKALTFIVVILATLVFLFISVAIGIWLELDNAIEGVYVLLFGIIAVFFIIMFLNYIISSRRDKKNEKNNTVLIEDSKYGTNAFIKDKFGHYNAVDLKISIGNHLPDVMFEDYQEYLKEYYFRGLDHVCEIQDQILNEFYAFSKEFYDDWEEQDEEGNPLTEERIKEEFKLTSIHVTVGDYGITFVTLWGWPGEDHLGNLRLGGHNFTITVNCKTNAFDYDFIG